MAFAAAAATFSRTSPPLFFSPSFAPPAADANKDHKISRQEFRASFNGLLALGHKEIDMLIVKFFQEGQEELDYDDFMSVIHAYADKPMRT